ncbi:MAG: RluA family pseudouridine synthase [Pseudomonadota bacterium]
MTADPSPEQPLYVTVEEADAGRRLDAFLTDALAEELPALSRTRVQALISQGHVSDARGTLSEASAKVKPGQELLVTVPAPVEAKPEAQDLGLDVVFEDEALIVVNKPAGLVVHPAPGTPDGTLVNALLAHCGDSLAGVGGVKRPGIVHRLDKDTSGLLVVAKNDEAHQGLVAQFAKRSILRRYAALVWGLPAEMEGEISGNIGRHPKLRQKMAVLAKGGRPAVTRYKVEEVLAGGAVSRITCRLLTGRTHQIRVHLAEIGHGLLGDPLYGRASPARRKALSAEALAALQAFGRQALHAEKLGFLHPLSGIWLEFEAALPADQQSLLDKLRVSRSNDDQSGLN